jgi:hypothetical protein
MFYKKVQTEEELNIFDSIWIPAWQEKGFELECLLGKVDRYLIKNENDENIGTISFRLYKNESPIDEVFHFHQIEKVKNNLGKIVEIENLAIDKEHRGIDNLKRVVGTIVDYGIKGDYKFLIAVIDPLFLRLVKRYFPVELIILSGAIQYKGTKLVPIMIDADQTLLHIDNYKWLKELFLSNKLHFVI